MLKLFRSMYMCFDQAIPVWPPSHLVIVRWRME